MSEVLPYAFFDRDAVQVAQALLGKYLVHHDQVYVISEVEAYCGMEDEACHARHGKTKRNAPMFWPPGYRYVYMIYGMYFMINVVTGPGTYPSAVLIRGLCRYNQSSWSLVYDSSLTGPGKLTKFLNITSVYTGQLISPNTGLWIEESGIVPSRIMSVPRIGIDYASDEWKHKPWRFFIPLKW